MALRLVTVSAMVIAMGTLAHGQAAEEYQVKAAFLYNFAKFVEWPSDAFKTPKDPMLLCVLGHNPFGGAIDEVIHGKSIGGRVVAFQQVDDANEARVCQVLFVPSLAARAFRSIHGNLKSFAILTVGEIPGFAAEGGVINFKLEDGRVRFEINPVAGENAQLRISSKLLSLAEIVKTEKLR